MNRNKTGAADLKADSSSPVAWVTGSGAKRVGHFIAKRFAQAGYRIVLHANQSIESASQFASELRASGTETLVVQGIVQDPAFADRAIKQIIEQFGRLDVLVNSAAIWDWKPFDEVSADDVRKQFEVNTLGTFLCSRAAGLQMEQQTGGGVIVLVGDWAVHRPYRHFAPYFVGKGSIETMTRSLAVELAARNSNIRVNSILPGPVMLDDSISSESAEKIRQQSLLKRHGTPDDVANAALFLAQQPFITGVSLPVDGGRSIYSGDQWDAIAHPTFAASPSP